MDTYIITFLMEGLIILNFAIWMIVKSIKPFKRKKKRQLWGLTAVGVLLLEVLFLIWVLKNGLDHSLRGVVDILGLIFSGIVMATGVILVLDRTFFEVIFNNWYVMKIVKIDESGIWGEICVKKFCYKVRFKESPLITRKRDVNEIVNVRVVNIIGENELEVVPI